MTRARNAKVFGLCVVCVGALGACASDVSVGLSDTPATTADSAPLRVTAVLWERFRFGDEGTDSYLVVVSDPKQLRSGDTLRVALGDGRNATVELDWNSHGRMIGRTEPDGGSVVLFIPDPAYVPPYVPRVQLDGVVVIADNQEDVVVVSIGKQDGVERGDEFIIYRDNDYISTIVVDAVFARRASCRTKPGMKRRAVAAGDLVTNRL